VDASDAPPVSAAIVEMRAATPAAGAVAGILFAVLFGVSVMIVARTMDKASIDTGAWLERDTRLFTFALGLIPFAGLFFLWFIAVVRAHLGRLEDQFFSTVFVGSGILFVALLFSAAASVGAIIATAERGTSGFVAGDAYLYGRNVVAQIFGIYALRMAAVFQMSQATLWLRTGVMPRWMALITFPVALVLLFIVTTSNWVILIFPGWVLMVSVYILLTRTRVRPEAAEGVHHG